MKENVLLVVKFQWRSAEEYFQKNLDEKIDVFSLANNFFGVLTGLEPFYDEEDEDNVKTRVKKGEKAYIDPRFKERSLAEAKLVEIIDLCHEYNPEDRPSIFEVVEFLRAAMAEVDEADRKEKEAGTKDETSMEN
jgi:serine/threonine protein kinase